MALDDLSGEQDVVSTSLTVDVPADSAQNLVDLNAASAELRSNMEAIARATQAYGDYLRTARDIGQTLRFPQGGGLGGGQYEGVGGRVDSSSVPDAVGALSSAAGRAEQMASNALGAGIGTAEQGLSGAISERGMGAGEGPMGGMGGLTNMLFAGQMVHAAGAGTYRTIRDRGGAFIAGQAMKRGLGPIAPAVASRMALSMAGRIALPIAAGVAVYQGAEAYYGLRSRGREFGEGAWGGLEKTIGEKWMALHPAISGEEASEIYNTAIAQGYAGRGDDLFGATTEFAKNNLIDLNMSVEDSFQLLQSNLDRTGQSIESLKNIMADLPELAEGSAKSLSTLNEQFLQINEYGVSQGLSGPAAANLGVNVAALWAGNPALAPDTANVIQAALSSTAFQSELAGKYGVDVPELAISMVGDRGQREGVDLVGQEAYNWLLDTARRYSPSAMPDASEEQRFYGWWQEIVSLAPGLAEFDITQLMNLFKQLQADISRGGSEFQDSVNRVNAETDFEAEEFVRGPYAGYANVTVDPNMYHSASLDTLAQSGEVWFVNSEGNRVKYDPNQGVTEEMKTALETGRRGGGYDVEFGGRVYTYGAVAYAAGNVPGANASFWGDQALNSLTITGYMTLSDGRTAHFEGSGTPNMSNVPANLP